MSEIPPTDPIPVESSGEPNAAVSGGTSEPGTTGQVTIGELVGTFKDNGRRLTLFHALTYTDAERVITVPAGFVTDFNSTPWGLWNFFPPWQYPQAGVVHDFLYQFNGVTRAEADQVHARILEALGCGLFKRRTVYLALRAGGWVAWKRYREAEKPAE